MGIITTDELSEHNLEHAVHRVHSHFEELSQEQQDQLFEQRIAYLKGITKRLTTSGNAWLNTPESAPNAHGKHKPKEQDKTRKSRDAAVQNSLSEVTNASMPSQSGRQEPGAGAGAE